MRYQENGASPTLLDEILPNFPKKYELTTPDRVFDKEESGHLLARSLAPGGSPPRRPRPKTQMTQNDSPFSLDPPCKLKFPLPLPSLTVVTSPRPSVAVPGEKKKGSSLALSLARSAFLLKAKGENKIFRRRKEIRPRPNISHWTRTVGASFLRPSFLRTWASSLP